jgi:pimeloyl-ACP methyl ester carboxylesterase
VRVARENLFLAHTLPASRLRRSPRWISGHGDSGGRYAFGATEHRDFLAVIEELVGTAGSRTGIVVVGLSMGGAIAAQALAARRDLPCRGLAMISRAGNLAASAAQTLEAGALRRFGCAMLCAFPGSRTRGLASRKPRASMRWLRS